MEQITVNRIKRAQLLLLFAALLLFLGGCGKEEGSGGTGMSDMAVPMSGGVDIDHFGSEAWSGGNLADEEGQSGGNPANEEGQSGGGFADGEAEVSHTQKEVSYAGADFLKACAAIGADQIYLAGYHGTYKDTKPEAEAYFWGKLEKESDVLQEFAMDIPENMAAARGCVDAEGNWHVLCLSQEEGSFTFDKAEVRVIDSQGSILKTVDYEEVLQTKRFIPYWMAVDEAGNYFLADNRTVLWVDGEGHVKKWYETEYLEGLGIGRSGQVYGVFTDDSGASYLGCLEPETGVVEQCASFEKELSSGFDVLQPGVHTELLMANRGDGLWRYDGESLALAVSIGEIIGNGNGQDIAAMGFLDDGRACIMSYEEEGYVFYYVPVEE